MSTSLDATTGRAATPVKTNGSNGHTNGNGNGNGSGGTAALPPPPAAPPKPWTIADSTRLYNIHQWGSGYFSINEEGHVAVHPTQDANLKVDLKTLVDELRERDIQLPMLIR